MGGKAILQRFYKSDKPKGQHESDNEGDEQPLILAICTPLMSRVHQHIYQSKELVSVDASSSFEDFNYPLFVMSTSSAATWDSRYLSRECRCNTQRNDHVK